MGGGLLKVRAHITYKRIYKIYKFRKIGEAMHTLGALMLLPPPPVLFALMGGGLEGCGLPSSGAGSCCIDQRGCVGGRGDVGEGGEWRKRKKLIYIYWQAEEHSIHMQKTRDQGQHKGTGSTDQDWGDYISP